MVLVLRMIPIFPVNVYLDLLANFVNKVRFSLNLNLQKNYVGYFVNNFFKISELPNDYVVTFGASDSFGTSEYALLEGKPFPNLTEVRVLK